MVYKIEDNNMKKDLFFLTKSLSSDYNIWYNNENFYCALKNYQKDYDYKKSKLFEIENTKKIFVKQITAENLSGQTVLAIEWLRDAFVRLDTQKMELENQEKLIKCKKFLDELEFNLKKELYKNRKEE